MVNKVEGSKISCLVKNLQEYFLSGERVDLSTFAPACLPIDGHSLDGNIAHIYGRFSLELLFVKNYTFGQDGA